MIKNRQDALAGVVFALLVLAVFGQIWFASTPLPFGGPNIIAAIAAAVLAVVLWLWQSVSLVSAAGARHAIAAGFVERFGPAVPALAVALAMWAWVLSVYLRTGTFDAMRMGQLTTGIGTLFALLCVLTARRARWLIAALVIATSTSALFGLGVLVVGKPLVDAWLQIAAVAETDLDTTFFFGRTAGAAAHPGTLGYQLAVAIVLGFSVLVFGVPVRHRHRRAGHGQWTRLVDVAVFLLVVFMLVALVVNASRSTMLGVVVGVVLCVVGVVTAPIPRRGVVRLLVAGPLLAGAVLALFNPWLNLGNLIEDVRPVRRGTGDIKGLAVGDAALSSGDPLVLGHRFDGYEPGVEYEISLRPTYRKGFGWRSTTIAKAGADGAILLTWRQDPADGVTGYQFRVRDVREHWTMRWQRFTPALRSQGAAPRVRELAVGSAGPTVGDEAIIGAQATGLMPARAYDVQLRAVLPAREGPPSQATGHADGEGRLVFTWRRGAWPMVAYQFRLRRPLDEQWPAWQDCVPSLPRPPVWPGLQQGVETLGVGGAAFGDERLGHAFAGLRSWKWYQLRVRETLVDGVQRAPRHGELTIRPERQDYFVATWPAARTPEGVAGYQFRVREVALDWLPWRDFTPSLSGRTPVPSLLPVGWSVVQNDTVFRHTLLGLPPGLNQLVQLRLRTAHGFGRESTAVGGTVRGDGSFVLAWRESSAVPVTGVQYRRRSAAKRSWVPWESLVEPFDGGRSTVDLNTVGRRGAEALPVARTAQGVGGALRVPWRVFQAKDLSARSRLPQLAVGWRYALDHPFGTGAYRPDRSHVGEELSEVMLEEILFLWPHNQFVHVLVVYGLPGLGLHLLFYFFLTRAAWRAGKLVWRTPHAELRFLVVAVVAAWASYSVNSLLFPTGPFLQDWGHYFVVGLLLSLESIVVRERR